MDQQTDESQISNPMEADPGKMFVGGLHSQTTADGLQRYFEQYGEVKEAVVMRDSVTKRSRGFGFVRFNDTKSVDKVSNTPTHTIDGKKVDPKRAIPKRPPPGQNQFKKVFVGGLPPDTTVQDIKDYFEGFGKVTEVLLMHDRNTKRLRGFGFVTFESDLAGKHVCEAGFHKLKGKSVECKSAQPKEVMMLQVPFPFARGYTPTLGGAMGFGFPTEWALNPQIYQNIANMYSNAIYGRGRGAYSGYAPQGFVNMPDHRRPGQSQYYAEYANV
jgi:RNA-binding protein Musashi